MTFTNPGAVIPERLGGRESFSLTASALKFPLQFPRTAMARALVQSSAVSSVRCLFDKWINRVVRQDAPESFDNYFADFAKTTPIVSVVFNQIAANDVLFHALNVHGVKNDVVSQDPSKYSVPDWNGYVGR